MIVEADPSLRSLLRMHLEAAGYEVIASSDLNGCREQCTIAHPHLILIDLLMADASFSNFFSEIRGNPGIADFPLIAGIATNEDSEFIASYLKTKGTIEMVFRKPFEFEDLNREITRLLSNVRNPEPIQPKEH
jgi:CheY-like chemotaxis protein